MIISEFPPVPSSGGSPDANAAPPPVRAPSLSWEPTVTGCPVSLGTAALVVIRVARPRLGPRSTPVGLAGDRVTLGHRLDCGAARFVRPRGLDRQRNEGSPRQRLD